MFFTQTVCGDNLEPHATDKKVFKKKKNSISCLHKKRNEVKFIFSLYKKLSSKGSMTISFIEDDIRGILEFHNCFFLYMKLYRFIDVVVA